MKRKTLCLPRVLAWTVLGLGLAPVRHAAAVDGGPSDAALAADAAPSDGAVADAQPTDGAPGDASSPLPEDSSGGCACTRVG